jgi:Tfp pilus assembly protein PilP
MRTTAIFFVAGLAAAGIVSAQAPAPAPAQAAPPPAQAPAPPSATVEPPPEDYTYQPEGRRDPFLNLLGTGNTPQAGGQRNEGAAGLTVAEITVRGVLASGGALIAMIQAPDNKTYIVRQGDKLNDGTIRSITPTGLVIVQEVNDPLSLVKQREIHKLLRSQEGVKE